MKQLGRVLLVAGALTVAAAGAAAAFEIEGASTVNPASLGLQSNLAPAQSGVYSLATPLGKGGDSAEAVSMSYGNSIAIPMPGVDLPTPAWASSPGSALSIR